MKRGAVLVVLALVLIAVVAVAMRKRDPLAAYTKGFIYLTSQGPEVTEFHPPTPQATPAGCIKYCKANPKCGGATWGDTRKVCYHTTPGDWWKPGGSADDYGWRKP